MKYKFLIATHGKLASGFKDSLDIIAGSEKQITVMNAYSEIDNPEEYLKCYISELSEEDILIACTDLMGGSVNQMLSRYLDGRRMHLITGVNLALLLELVMCDEITEDVIESTIELARGEIKYVNKEILSNTQEETTEADFWE